MFQAAASPPTGANNKRLTGRRQGRTKVLDFGFDHLVACTNVDTDQQRSHGDLAHESIPLQRVYIIRPIQVCQVSRSILM
jgi:hypothetical protein